MYGSRFMLVLIGTPGLVHSVLGGDTFAERFEYHSLNMLETEAAMEALRVPLATGGISASDALLQAAALDAQRYPFFIQVWGEALWDYAAGHGIERLTDEDMQAVLPGVARRRNDFYNGRFKEIRPHDDLFAATVALADAYKSFSRLDEQAIVDIIRLALEAGSPEPAERKDRAETALQELIRIGYIWQPAGTPYVEAGIPSLMTYVAEQRNSRQPQLPAADLRRIGATAAKRLGA